ncbi:MAG TPA: TonB-dependent receptor plug domain-containing protein, partial [Sphingobium sp.]|nr:TonB-dependent receptor plug domain-containing protein [Sphingobium sp.]
MAILYAGMAMAQAPAEPGQSAPPSAQRNEGGDISLGDIVVTAQKRSERLQDVPVAVAAVTPETLTKTGIESTAALMSVVPGLNVNDSPFGFRPFLRGVGTSSSAAGNENSVSTYVDNIYMTSMNGGLLNLSSIESIEVLKGPQGTLFGRNATGGVIHVKTRDPSHDLGGSFSLSFDNYETVIAKAYLTGGLSDNLAADIAVYYRDQGDGYGTNLATGSDVGKDKSFTVRSKLLFTPTDN